MRKTTLLISVVFFCLNLNGQEDFLKFARKKSTVDVMVKTGLKGILNDSGFDFNNYNFVSYLIPNGDSINISSVIYSYDKNEMIRHFTIILKTPVYYKMGLKESGYELLSDRTLYKFSISNNKFRIEYYKDSTTGLFRTLIVAETIQDAKTGKFVEAILGRGWAVNRDEYSKTIDNFLK